MQQAQNVPPGNHTRKKDNGRRLSRKQFVKFFKEFLKAISSNILVWIFYGNYVRYKRRNFSFVISLARQAQERRKVAHDTQTVKSNDFLPIGIYTGNLIETSIDSGAARRFYAGVGRCGSAPVNTRAYSSWMGSEPHERPCTFFFACSMTAPLTFWVVPTQDW